MPSINNTENLPDSRLQDDMFASQKHSFGMNGFF
jgi:hypothetical protein